MSVALGTLAYEANASMVLARGYRYGQAELDAARNGLVRQLLTDEHGRTNVADLYNSLGLTEFGTENVIATLRVIPEEDHSKGWREGEALAEAWLVTHKHCEFPWPFHRDLRHHRASLPGAELVGFSGTSLDDVRLAFGQVKTSKDPTYPPSVVDAGETSLIRQGLQLRDDENIKKTLVDYLAYRATHAVVWAPKFRAAAKRYFESGTLEIAIFGVLVRDVPADARDLSLAARKLADGCHASTRIELFSLYLPTDCIPAPPPKTLKLKSTKTAEAKKPKAPKPQKRRTE